MESNSIELIQKIRKRSLQSFVLFLALSALIAIATILIGNLREFEIKVLISTTVIAIFSIASMGCALYAEKSKQPIPAAVGAGISLVAAILIIIGVWAEMKSDEYWKTAFVFSVFGIGSAHYFLLASVELAKSHTWVTSAALVVILSNALSIALAIVFEVDEDFMFKTIAVLSILSALVTCVIPILYRIGKKAITPDEEEESKLILTKESEYIYISSKGDRFKVEKIT